MFLQELGFIRVASAIPNVRVADTAFNRYEIIELIHKAEEEHVDFICFPELCITGYTCQDLFLNDELLINAEHEVDTILSSTRLNNVTSIIGCPINIDGTLYNCAIVFKLGKILGIVPKTYLPNYKEFYEKRWFTSGKNINTLIDFAGQKKIPFSTNMIFSTEFYPEHPIKYGIEICEDVWSTIPPSSYLSLAGAQLIFNLSASNDIIGKHQYLCDLLKQQSARCIAGYVYSSCGYGESTSDLVFGGNAIIYQNGSLLGKSERFKLDSQLIIADIDINSINNERLLCKTFSDNKDDVSKYYINAYGLQGFYPRDIEDYRGHIKGTPFIPTSGDFETRCQEIITIQAEGLARRLEHTDSKKAVIGVSGGLDSTLSLLIACKAMDMLKRPHTDIVGITMPCFGTTKRTKNNSIELMKALNVTSVEINIADAVNQHFKDIGQDPENHNITYENCQARERTQVLMDYGNKVGGFVLGTGDLSELALGWCTYNADHMSMYNVNVSIPKTLVKFLVQYFEMYEYQDTDTANILTDILDTPVSPELLPPTADGQIAQVTEDNIGPYLLHDFFLYYFLRKGFNIQKIYYLATIADFGINKFTNEEILKWLKVFVKRFFSQQFKRNCLPDGPKVGTVSLSPRGDWRMPADASNFDWINSLSKLDEPKIELE